MANYINAGTASITAGQTTITFAGVSLSLLKAGDQFMQGGASGILASVDVDAGTAELVDAWGGATASTAAYAVLVIPEASALAVSTRTIMQYLAGPILSIAAMTGDDAPADGDLLAWDDAAQGWAASTPTGSGDIVRATEPTIADPTITGTATTQNMQPASDHSSNLGDGAKRYATLFASTFSDGATATGEMVGSSGTEIQIGNGSDWTAINLLKNVNASGAIFGQAGSSTLLSLGTGTTKRVTVDSGASSIYPEADNSWSCGFSSQRWSVVYAGTGSISTSDEREKLWRGPLTDPELAAGAEIFAELGGFQFLDMIATKGSDGARVHFGARAQRIKAVLDEHGLASQSYALVCYDEWDAIAAVPEQAEVRDEETGEIVTPFRAAVPAREAGNRWGLRYDELSMFLLCVIDMRLAALETRIAEGGQ